MQVPAFHVVVPSMDHRPVGADFSASNRAHKSLQPVYRGSAGNVTGNDSDVAVSQAEQVAGSAFRGTSVVHAHPPDIRVAHQRVTVRVDHRKISQNRPGLSTDRVYL